MGQKHIPLERPPKKKPCGSNGPRTKHQKLCKSNGDCRPSCKCWRWECSTARNSPLRKGMCFINAPCLAVFFFEPDVVLTHGLPVG
eukprot:419399-Pyramimonas_sp.AAC.1